MSPRHIIVQCCGKTRCIVEFFSNGKILVPLLFGMHRYCNHSVHYKCRSDSPLQHVYLLSLGVVESSSRTFWKALAEVEVDE